MFVLNKDILLEYFIHTVSFPKYTIIYHKSSLPFLFFVLPSPCSPYTFLPLIFFLQTASHIPASYPLPPFSSSQPSFLSFLFGFLSYLPYFNPSPSYQ